MNIFEVENKKAIPIMQEDDMKTIVVKGLGYVVMKDLDSLELLVESLKKHLDSIKVGV